MLRSQGNIMELVKHDLMTTLEGEVTFAIGYPTEATAPPRRVLDAAHKAARLLVD